MVTEMPIESGHLNFFLPFRRLEPHHEDQLTRALLVMLRYSPLARQPGFASSR
jgi:hypothetical protein